MEVNTTISSSTESQQSGPTLKLLQNKTHIGPVSDGVTAKASLSKAAGKIMFDSNLKVTIVDTGKEVGKESDPSKKPVVRKISLPSGAEAGGAVYFMLAWDKLCNGVGTPGYQNKYQEFAKAQTNTYAELGLKIGPNEVKPELTEQQRRMYNAKMRKYAFSYYEYRLSFKQPGVKAVRSLTYRTLKPMDLDNMISKLTEQVKYLSTKLNIKFRQ